MYVCTCTCMYVCNVCVCVCNVCVCVCVGMYIRVGWNPCPGHSTKVSSEGPTPSSIKFSQVTDLTDDDSPLRLPTSKSALFIHVGWNPCPRLYH